MMMFMYLLDGASKRVRGLGSGSLISTKPFNFLPS